MADTLVLLDRDRVKSAGEHLKTARESALMRTSGSQLFVESEFLC